MYNQIMGVNVVAGQLWKRDEHTFWCSVITVSIQTVGIQQFSLLEEVCILLVAIGTDVFNNN